MALYLIPERWLIGSHRFALALVCVGAWGAVLPLPAKAQVACSAEIGNFQFNSVVPWRTGHWVDASLNVSCENKTSSEYAVAACMSLEQGSAGTSIRTRQLTMNGTNQGPALQVSVMVNGFTNFGSYYDSAGPVEMVTRVGPNSSSHAYFPVTVSINNGQSSAVAGEYFSSFQGMQTRIAVAAVLPPLVPSCKNIVPDFSNTFGFEIHASIPDFCEITSEPADMVFADNDAVAIERQIASTSLAVRCTNSTAYQIYLEPANGNQQGVGEMLPALRTSGGYDSIPYALYQDSGATSRPWGNQQGSHFAGTGTGESQVIPIYGAVHAGTRVAPGAYVDHVIVTIKY